MLLVWPCSREGSNKLQLVRQFDDEEEDDDSDGRTTENALGGSSGNFLFLSLKILLHRAQRRAPAPCLVDLGQKDQSKNQSYKLQTKEPPRKLAVTHSSFQKKEFQLFMNIAIYIAAFCMYAKHIHINAWSQWLSFAILPEESPLLLWQVNQAKQPWRSFTKWDGWLMCMISTGTGCCSSAVSD